VATHGLPGWIGVMRHRRGRIVAHWDVLQVIPQAPKNGNTMV
jgi:predicted SnoaL-like aldol condensation-catalyzing enzyme